MLVKVPQITKILNNKSADGLNVIAVFFEILAITFNLSYSYVSGFPFSAYGDGVFLALQTIIIACMIFYFGGSTLKAVLLFVAYAGFCFVLMSGLTPLHVLWSIQAFNIPILLVGKSVQAVTNYRNGSTGQLSAVTCSLLFFGSSARIFTSFQETGDAMMILTYVVSTAANALILGQLLWYWNSGKKGGKVGAKEAAAKKQSKTKSKKAD